MAVVHYLFGLLCMAGLVVAAIAGAGYAQSADYRNQTDSFGNAHTAQGNVSASTAGTLTGGVESISSGMLILLAAFGFIIFVIFGLVFMKRPSW